MLPTFFLICSAAAAAVWALLCRPDPGQLWQGALIFLLCPLALSLLFLLVIAAASLFFPKRTPIRRQSRLCRAFVVIAGELVAFWTGARVHFNGEDLLPRDGRFVMVCNHRSAFDPLLKFKALARYNVAFVSKPENIRLPVLGRLAVAAGFLPIDRENDREALKTILCAADYLKRDLCSFCVYPEGKRSKNCELLPFHAGSFKIAQRAKTPLVVAAIRGTEKVRNNFLRRRTDVYLDVLAVIPPSEVCAAKTVELSEWAYTMIKRHLDAAEGRTEK